MARGGATRAAPRRSTQGRRLRPRCYEAATLLVRPEMTAEAHQPTIASAVRPEDEGTHEAHPVRSIRVCSLSLHGSRFQALGESGSAAELDGARRGRRDNVRGGDADGIRYGSVSRE